MKTSLHILGILLLALFISATSGCGGGETKPDTGGTTVTPPPPPTPEEQLVGKYTLIKYSLKSEDGITVNLVPPKVSGTLVLKDDDQRSWTMDVHSDSGPLKFSGSGWTATATHLKLWPEEDADTYQLSGSILTFELGKLTLSWQKL